jgi:PAS domain S-box-containing protein
MKTALRTLIVEDSEDDALLMLYQIEKGGYEVEFERVETAEKMKLKLKEKKWDIILSDYSMPNFNGLEALSILKKSDLEIPFIIISGAIGEDVAVEAMKAGAHDYIMKNNLQRLLPAVERELHESVQRAEKRLLEQKQKVAEESLRRSEMRLREFNLLQGLLLALVPVEQKLKLVTEAVVRIMDVDFARIWMIKPGDRCQTGCIHAQVDEGPHVCMFRDQCLHLMASSGRYTHTDGQVHARVPFGCYKIGKVAAAEESKFLTNEATTDPRVHNNAWAKKLGLVSFAGYRLVDVNGIPLGVLALFSKHEITADDDSFMEGIALSTSRVLHSAWAEAALHESESRYRMLFNTNADGILIADIETKTINYANPAICQMLCYSEDELRTMSIVDIHPRKDLLHVVAEFESLARKEKTLAPDIPCLRKDGSIVYADINSATIAINGKPKIVGLFRDITERKSAEEALRHERTLLRLLIDNIPDYIYSKDTACRKTLTNLADVRHLGAKSDEEVLGKDDFAFFPREIAEKFYSDDQSVIQTGQPILNREEFAFDENGQKKWLLTSKFPLIDEKCQIIGLVGITHDITKRKQEEEALRESEERFHLLFELSPEAIMLIDPFNKEADWPIIDCNETACKMNGYSREELISKSIDIVNTTHGTPEERAEYLNKLKKAPILHVETFHRHRDGHIFPIEVSTSIVTFQGHEMVLGIDRDITERKYAEEEIKLKNEQLQKLNAEKDLLFSIIAHDLKSPFNAIVGFSNLLIECANEKDIDALEKYSKIIKQSSERAMDLLINLMDWSRSQTGRIKFNPEFFDLSDLINQTALLLTDIASQKSLTIDKELHHHTAVYADKAMIGTVLRNLVSNSIKFSRLNGKITISTSESLNKVVISVQDTGVGIPHGVIDKLFQIDEIYTTPGTQNEKGTGLGLIICKEFIEKHKENIWVESKEGEGTTFYFTIPTKKGDIVQ